MDGSNRKIRVLYIGGWQRSGSTILGNILNETEGFFHAGEVCFVWTHRPWSKYLCGCGTTFDSCSLWRDVFEQAFGSMEAMNEYYGKRPSSRKLALRLLGLGGSQGLVDEAYLTVLQKLYHAIAKVTGCRVIVDSSKFPSHAYLLQQIPSIDLRMLHLVRDPRGTAYSWQRKVRRIDIHADGQLPMPQFSLSNSSLKWLLWNAETELLGRRRRGRYMRMRYEDLMAAPATQIGDIVKFCDGDAPTPPDLHESQIRFGANHSIVGNPSRAKRGMVRLKGDDEWAEKMIGADRLKVKFWTWPLMLRYGYDVI